MGLFDIFTGDSAKRAAEENRQLLSDNRANGSLTLSRGQDSAIGALGQAAGYYAPLAAKYGAGTDLYLDSLGVNGADGNTRATNAFQAGPGYQWSVDQSLEGLNRKANAAGGLVGGNTLAALSDRAGQMANQEFGSWQDRLAGLISPEMAATSGQAGAVAAQAPIYTNTANNIANLGTNTTNGIASQNTQQANAETAASGNLWNFGLNAATALASGGTSLLGGLGNWGGGLAAGKAFNNNPATSQFYGPLN